MAVHAAEYVLSVAPYFSEFLGTFFVILTTGLLAVKEGAAIWRPGATGFAVMAATYATSTSSGAHLSPAVSLVFALTRKISWSRAWSYVVVQILAGVAAAGAVSVISMKPLPNLKPKRDYDYVDVVLVQGIFSTVYCFVALNCMASLQNNPKGARNQFFGLAMGFIAIACGYVCTEIAGVSINPAATLGFATFPAKEGFSLAGFAHALVWTGFQCAGALVAALLFFLVRPEELAVLGLVAGDGLGCHQICMALNLCGRRKQPEVGENSDEESESDEEVDSGSRVYRASFAARLLSEVVGTYMILLTFGLCSMAAVRNSKSDSDTKSVIVHSSAPLAYGAAVTSLTYALGSVSGGHFNPAVTLAVMCSSRDAYVWAEGPTRIIAQAGAAVLAAVTYVFIVSRGTGKTDLSLLPHLGPSGAQVGEMIFTMVICYVVLCVRTVKSPRYTKAISARSFEFGLAVGLAYAAAGWILEPNSGGYLNPAAALTVASADILHSGIRGLLQEIRAEKLPTDVLWSLLHYVCWQFAGGVLASVLFYITHPREYRRDPLMPPLLAK
eukprot:TRINITY_DN7687_c1_g2_i1.p1 TRINITY_DN7687_c1_g2~~TRINITY_DN7687_c1_g2_i1.p1  ORF type:complete len:555 (+),score=74.67 TRINITY_DN7687_c1_g2_i1:145-1809(+)